MTLPVKVYINSQLKLVDKFLKASLKGLQVEVKACEVTPEQWVQISVSGEDEKVALRYLADEIGLHPTNLADIGKFSELNARIIALEKSRDQLHVDMGISIDTTIPLQYLQAQLADGRKVALRKLVELFGLCENLPLTIKILHVDKEKNHAEAILSEKQLNQYQRWIRSLLDRLIVLGASVYEVKLALRKAGLYRDVLNVEPLGLFEFAAVCKLGTDAQGLIPKIGRNLRTATFAIFSPKKVLEFLDYSGALISV